MNSSQDKIKVAIAEDEAYNRQLLESYLESFSQIEVVASVKSGKEIIDIINQADPAVVFLDIEMPEVNGLSAAALLKEKKKDIYIVFVTAHSNYAADAYQIDAVDYLVKPITKERIEKTITKIEKLLGLNKVNQLVKEFLIFKNNHEIYFINPDDIFFLEKEIRKTIAHTVNGQFITTEPLRMLEKKLNQNFFRCHKSFIININKIEKIIPIADRIYKLTFYNYHNYVTMSRKKLEELYNIIESII